MLLFSPVNFIYCCRQCCYYCSAFWLDFVCLFVCLCFCFCEAVYLFSDDLTNFTKGQVSENDFVLSASTRVLVCLYWFPELKRKFLVPFMRQMHFFGKEHQLKCTL